VTFSTGGKVRSLETELDREEVLGERAGEETEEESES
jgi:hypothetical protein